jgi:hypothetical protein
MGQLTGRMVPERQRQAKLLAAELAAIDQRDVKMAKDRADIVRQRNLDRLSEKARPR